MQCRFGYAIWMSAALISLVNASTSPQNTWSPNATIPAPTSGPSMTLGTLEVAVYEPAPLTVNAYPDLTHATALANVPEGAECSIFAGEVNVYYFASSTSTTNTNCYTGTGAPPPPSEIAQPNFPNVYVVVSSLSAGNAHTRIGSIYQSAIFSMMPSELSTVAGTAGPSAVFNFADLPCPPPDVAAADAYFYNPVENPTRPYMPRIIPPSQILQLDPAWASCTFPANFQFFDPPRAFERRGGGEGPGGKMKRDFLDVQAPEATITPAPIEFHRGHPRQVAL